MKNSVFIILIAFLASCNAELTKTTSKEFRQEISGEAQGTTYRIVYYDLKERNFKPAVDSILRRIDASLSTYQRGSIIDRWNKSDSGSMVDQLFIELLLESWQLYQATEGAFDPTVKPLVSYWGFGPEKFEGSEEVNPMEVDDLVKLVSFDTLRLKRSKVSRSLGEFEQGETGTDSVFLEKPVAGMQLDFNAIGQGWSVDKVADHLRTEGVKVFCVEIGGEIVAGYPKPDGSKWRFGIDKPVDHNTERELQAVINLRNKGLATSGNYRKFYERDGIRYSHTIDPSSGYPVQHSLLSATVVSQSAAKSDALATAFMVMGMDSTIEFLSEREYLGSQVYLIASDSVEGYRIYTSSNLEGLIEELEESMPSDTAQ